MSEPLRAISLFSGAGGMDVGFENAGIKVVFANELVSDAAETYKANHPRCFTRRRRAFPRWRFRRERSDTRWCATPRT